MRAKRLLPWIILAAGGLILGCADSHPVFVEHLAIININPSHGAVEIGYDTDVVVTFSEVLRPETVTSGAVCLTDSQNPPEDPAAPCAGNPVPAQVSYNASSLSIVLDPVDPLIADEEYTLHLTQDITGDNGSLPTIVRARFQTIPTM